MRRSIQVGIALLVLSVRLWDKLFFISDFVGKAGLSNYMTQEFVSRALLGFFFAYYCLIKVV